MNRSPRLIARGCTQNANTNKNAIDANTTINRSTIRGHEFPSKWNCFIFDLIYINRIDRVVAISVFIVRQSVCALSRSVIIDDGKPLIEHQCMTFLSIENAHWNIAAESTNRAIWFQLEFIHDCCVIAGRHWVINHSIWRLKIVLGDTNNWIQCLRLRKRTPHFIFSHRHPQKARNDVREHQQWVNEQYFNEI